MRVKHKALLEKDKGKFGQEYVILGWQDYIAARFLLNNDFLPQGTVLASIGVEKYLKAVLSSQGVVKRGHLDNIEIVELVKQTGVDLLEYINQEFLKFLGTVYQLRVVDQSGDARARL